MKFMIEVTLDKKGLALKGQPLFICVVRLLTVAFIGVDVFVFVISWVSMLMRGTLFLNPLGESVVFGPVFWVIMRTCVLMTLMLIRVLVTVCLGAVACKLFCKHKGWESTCTGYPFSEDIPKSLLFRVLVAYDCVFVLTEVGGGIKLIVVLVLAIIQSDDELMKVVMLMLGPIFIGLGIWVIIITFLFCIGILVLLRYAIKMLNVISCPVTRGGEEREEQT